MNVSTKYRTPLFDEVLVEGTVLQHYTAERQDYGALLDELQRASSAMRAKVGRRCIWHINSVAFGGGVAEMLPPHLCLLRELGIDVRWLIFKPKHEQFFRLTKGLHNALHDMAVPGLNELLPHYLNVSAQGAAELATIIGPNDCLVVHDPQPLCAASRFLTAHPHPAIWRCHIGYPTHTPTVDRTWELLGEYFPPFQRIVLSDREYVFDTDRPIDIIQPSINPFSTKNRHYAEPADPALARLVSFNRDGSGPRPSLPDILDSRYFLHVSRWDGLKGIDRVIAAFERFVSMAPDTAHDIRLVIAGPDPVDVADDPEGLAYFDQYTAMCAQLPREVQRRVYLACVSMKDNDANAEIVGRLQQHAYAVFQLSREEGFGLTTTEALFRGKPVVVSSAFGLKKQVLDGHNGIVLDEPNIEDKAADIMHRLVTDYHDFSAMARAARENCLRSSTQISQIPKWSDAIQATIQRFGDTAKNRVDARYSSDRMRSPAGRAAGVSPSSSIAMRPAPVPGAINRGHDDPPPAVFWLTGISGAGKSTVARSMQELFSQYGWRLGMLDGDDLRARLNVDLGFSDVDRAENVRRIAEVASLMADAGLLVVVSCISPKAVFRESARSIVGHSRFIEIHIDTPLAVAEARDPKGLYKLARAGTIKAFTGLHSAYETPDSPAIRIDTTATDAAQAAAAIGRYYMANHVADMAAQVA